MAVAIRIHQSHVDAMVAHALEEAPLECCGIIGARDGTVTGVYRAKNREASPYRFSIDPLETRRIGEQIEDEASVMAGFYHSHTGSGAIPSPTDIRMMGPLFGPPFVHFLVGVADREQPVVRCWYIVDGDRTEQEFEVVD